MKPSKTGYNIIQIGAEESLTKETIHLMNQPIKKARIKNGWPKTMKDRVDAVSPSSTSPKEKPRKLGNQSKTKKTRPKRKPGDKLGGSRDASRFRPRRRRFLMRRSLPDDRFVGVVSSRQKPRRNNQPNSGHPPFPSTFLY